MLITGQIFQFFFGKPMRVIIAAKAKALGPAAALTPISAKPVKGFDKHNLLISLVPGAGLEPARG
jgi:hypothetical protein